MANYAAHYVGMSVLIRRVRRSARARICVHMRASVHRCFCVCVLLCVFVCVAPVCCVCVCVSFFVCLFSLHHNECGFFLFACLWSVFWVLYVFSGRAMRLGICAGFRMWARVFVRTFLVFMSTCVRARLCACDFPRTETCPCVFFDVCVVYVCVCLSVFSWHVRYVCNDSARLIAVCLVCARSASVLQAWCACDVCNIRVRLQSAIGAWAVCMWYVYAYVYMSQCLEADPTRTRGTPQCELINHTH